MGDIDNMDNIVLGTHYEGCWRHMGHHACAVTKVEQLWTKVEQLCHERHAERIRHGECDAVIAHFMRQVRTACEQAGLGKDHALHDYVPLLGNKITALIREVSRLRHELHDEQVRRDEWEKMYNQAVDRNDEVETELYLTRDAAQEMSDEVQELWLSPCEAEGLRRQLAKAEARLERALIKCQMTKDGRSYWYKKYHDAETTLDDCGIGGIFAEFDGLPDAIKQMAQHIKELTQGPVEVEMTDAEIGEVLQTEVRKRVTAEADAHTLSKALDECTQTVHTERQLRWEAEKHRADARLAQHVLELKAGLERQSAYTERALRQEAEQCAEHAETLAALVTPELAQWLERFASLLYRDRCDYERDTIDSASALAARIRKALALEAGE